MPSGGQCSTTWKATTAPSVPAGRPPSSARASARSTREPRAAGGLDRDGIRFDAARRDALRLEQLEELAAPAPDVEHRPRKIAEQLEIEPLAARDLRGAAAKALLEERVDAGRNRRRGHGRRRRGPGAARHGRPTRAPRSRASSIPFAARELLDVAVEPIDRVGEAARRLHRERVEGGLVAPEKPQRPDDEPLQRLERGARRDRRRQDLLRPSTARRARPP